MHSRETLEGMKYYYPRQYTLYSTVKIFALSVQRLSLRVDDSGQVILCVHTRVN